MQNRWERGGEENQRVVLLQEPSVLKIGFRRFGRRLRRIVEWPMRARQKKVEEAGEGEGVDKNESRWQEKRGNS